MTVTINGTDMRREDNTLLLHRDGYTAAVGPASTATTVVDAAAAMAQLENVGRAIIIAVSEVERHSDHRSLRPHWTVAHLPDETGR